MKLRLPKSLMTAMVAVMAASTPLATTVATGTMALAALSARADEITINSDTTWGHDYAVEEDDVVKITGGTLTIGNNTATQGTHYGYGESITVDSGAKLALQLWGGEHQDASTTNKVVFDTQVVLNGGTLETEAGSHYFAGGVVVLANSTITNKFAYHGNVYGPINRGDGTTADTTLTMQRTGGFPDRLSLVVFSEAGDFNGKVVLQTSGGAEYLINNSDAFQHALLQLTNSHALYINTDAVNLAGLSGTGNIQLNTNANFAPDAPASTLITIAGDRTDAFTYSGVIGNGVSISVADGVHQGFSNITLGSGSTLTLGDATTLGGTLTLNVGGEGGSAPIIASKGTVDFSSISLQGATAGTAYAVLQMADAESAYTYTAQHGGVTATSFDNLTALVAEGKTVMAKTGNTVGIGSTITLDGGAIKIANNSAAYDGAYTSEDSTRTATATFSGDTTLDLTFGAGGTKSKVFNAVRPGGSSDNVTVTLNTLNINGNTNTAANGSATINGAEGVNVVYTKSGALSLYSQNLTLGDNVSVAVTGTTDIGGATKLTLNEGSSFTTNGLRLTGGNGNYTGAVTINGGILTVTGNSNTRANTNSSLMISHWRANGTLTLEKGQLIANDAIMYLSWDINGNNNANSVGGSYIQNNGEAWLKGISAQRRDNDAPSQSSHSVATLSGGTLHLGAGGLQYIFSDANGNRFTFGDVTIIAEEDWKTDKGEGSIGLTATEAGKKTTLDANGHNITFNHALTGGGKLLTTGEGIITFNKNVAGDLEVRSGNTVIYGDVTDLSVTGGTAWIRHNVTADVQLKGGALDVGKGVTLGAVTAPGAAEGGTVSSTLETHAANITTLTVQSGAAVEQHGAIIVNTVDNSGSLRLNGPVILGGSTADEKTHLASSTDLYIRRVLDSSATYAPRSAVKTGAGDLELGDGMGDGNILELNGGTLSGNFNNGTLKVGVDALTASGKTLTVDGGRIDFAGRVSDGALTAVNVGGGKLVLESGNLVFGSAMASLMAAADDAGSGWSTDLFTYAGADSIESDWTVSNMMVDGSSVDSHGKFFIYDGSGNITRTGILTVGETALTLSFGETLNLQRLIWTGATDSEWNASSSNWETESNAPAVFNNDDLYMVVFGANAGTQATITLVGALTPSDITVLGDYAFTGEGSISDIPRLNVGDADNTAHLTIGTDNRDWAGEVYVKNGSILTLTHAKALGISAVSLGDEHTGLVISGAGASGTYANHIVGDGSLTVAGGAQVLLTNSSNSYSGSTVIEGEGSVLTVTNGGALGNGDTLSIGEGGTFAIQGASPEDEMVKLTFARTISGAGDIKASYAGTGNDFYSYEFTRNVSGWTGTYTHDDGGTGVGKTGTVEFNGGGDINASFVSDSSAAGVANELNVLITGVDAARVINGSFSKTEGNKLNITLNGATTNTLNGAVDATSLTILGATSNTFNEAVTADSLTIYGNATTFNKNVTVEDLTLTGGSLTRGADNNLTVNGRFDTDLTLTFNERFTGGAGFTKAGSGSLTVQGTASVDGVSVEGGSLEVRGGHQRTYNDVNLSGGQLTLYYNDSNFTGGNVGNSTTKTVLNNVNVGGDFLLKTRWNASLLELDTLALNGNTLTIEDGHCATTLSVISLTGTSAGEGAIVVRQNETDAANHNDRHVHVSIDGGATLNEALLSFESKNSSSAKVSIGISTDASVGGLGEGLADVKLMSLGKASIGAGGTAAYDRTSDARRTLTITGTSLTDGGADTNTFNGVVGNNLNLVMDARQGGTQIFNGDLSAFDGSVSVANGTLVFAGSTTPTISSLTVGTADTSEETGAVFDLQTATATGIAQLQGNANGVITNSSETLRTLTVGKAGTNTNSNFAGAITGNLSVEVVANTLTLTGASTSTADLIVTNGKAVLSGAGATWAGDIYATGSGSTFRLERSSREAQSVTLAGEVTISNGATMEVELWQSGPSNGQSVLTTDKSTVTADIILDSANLKITDGANRFSDISTTGTSKIESVYSKGQYIDHLSGDGTLTLQQNSHSWGGNTIVSIDGDADFAGTISMVHNAPAAVQVHLVSVNGTSLGNAVINTGASANNKLALNTEETTIAGLAGAGGVILVPQSELAATDTPLTAATLKIAAADDAANVFSGSIAEGITLELSSGKQGISGNITTGVVSIAETAELFLSGDACIGGLSGTGAISTLTAPGTLSIAAADDAANVFSGSIAAGVDLQLTSGVQTLTGLNMAGTLGISSGAVLTLNGDAISLGTLVNNGGLVFANTAADVTISSAIANGTVLNLGNLVVADNLHLTGLLDDQLTRVSTDGEGNTLVSIYREQLELTWNGTTATHVWDTATKDWVDGSSDRYFWLGDNAVFNASAESKLVNVTTDINAASMTVSDAYTFDVDAGKTLTTGTLTVQDGGSVTKTGAGTLVLDAENAAKVSAVNGGVLEVTDRAGNTADYSGISLGQDGTLALNLSTAAGGTQLQLAAGSAGTVHVLSGALAVNSARMSQLGDASLDMADDTTIVFAASTNTTADFGNDINVAQGNTLNLRAYGDSGATSNNILSGAITGEGTLKKTDGGKITLTGDMSGFHGGVVIGNTNSTNNRLIFETDARITSLAFEAADKGAVMVGTGNTLTVDRASSADFYTFIKRSAKDDTHCGTIRIGNLTDHGGGNNIINQTFNVYINFELANDWIFNGWNSSLVYSGSMNVTGSITSTANITLGSFITMNVNGGSLSAAQLSIGHTSTNDKFAARLNLSNNATLSVNSIMMNRTNGTANYISRFNMTSGTLNFTGSGDAFKLSAGGAANGYLISITGGNINTDAVRTVNADITLGDVTIGSTAADGAAAGLTFVDGKTVTWKGLIENDGTALAFNGDIALASTVTDANVVDAVRPYTQFSDATADAHGGANGNGYEDTKRWLVHNSGNGTSTLANAQEVTVGDNSYALVADADGIYFDYTPVADRYYVNNGTVLFGGGNSTAADTTGSLVLNGGTLEVGATALTKDVRVIKAGSGLRIDSGATVDKTRITVASGNLVLSGAGTYNINADSALGANVTIGTDWTGTVTTAANGTWNTSGLMREGSSVLLTTATGRITQLNTSDGRLISDADVTFDTLNIASGTTILDGRGTARNFTAGTTFDMRGTGNAFTGDLKVVNGANLKAKEQHIWINETATHQSVIYVDKDSSFTATQHNDTSVAIYAISGRGDLEDMAAIQCSIGTSVNDAGAECMTYTNAKIDYKGGDARTLDATVENSDVTVSGGGTLSIGDKAIHKLSAANGSAKATGTVQVTEAEARGANASIALTTGSIVAGDVTLRSATNNGSIGNATVTSAGIAGAKTGEGDTLQVLGELNSLTVAFAAENTLAALSNVTMQDVTLTNGAVSFGENVTAIAASATAVPVSSGAMGREAVDLTPDLTATTVKSGGSVSGTLTVDVTTALLDANRGKTLAWTILDGVTLEDDFSLELGGVLGTIVQNGLPGVWLSVAGPGEALATVTPIQITVDNIGGISTGGLLAGYVDAPVDLMLTLENIPEPTSGALSVLALAALAARRRRKAK